MTRFNQSADGFAALLNCGENLVQMLRLIRHPPKRLI